MVGIGKAFTGVFVASIALVVALAISSSPRYGVQGTFKTSDLIVDDTAKVGGVYLSCVGVEAGCVGKPNFSVDPTTGHVAVTGTGADWTTIRSLFDSIETLSAATADQQNNQTILNGTMDCTTSDHQTFAGEFTNQVSCSAGGHTLTNIALLINAQNGTTNVALESGHGDWHQEDTAGTFANDGHTQLHDLSIEASSPGAVDLTNATGVTLGTHLVTPIEAPGSTSVTPIFGLGTSIGGEAEQLAIKNTVTGSPGLITGIDVGFDTTVDGSARGGIMLSRGASGNFNVLTSAGFWMSGSGDLSSDLAANDLMIMNLAAGKSIVFQAGGTGATHTVAIMRPTGHQVIGTQTLPSLSAGCTSGGGSSIVGGDGAFKLTTGATSTACTVTFANTWTLSPVCTITSEAGATHTETVTPDTVVFSANQSSKVYNAICVGQPGST